MVRRISKSWYSSSSAAACTGIGSCSWTTWPWPLVGKSASSMGLHVPRTSWRLDSSPSWKQMRGNQLWTRIFASCLKRRRRTSASKNTYVQTLLLRQWQKGFPRGPQFQCRRLPSCSLVERVSMWGSPREGFRGVRRIPRREKALGIYFATLHHAPA